MTFCSLLSPAYKSYRAKTDRRCAGDTRTSLRCHAKGGAHQHRRAAAHSLQGRTPPAHVRVFFCPLASSRPRIPPHAAHRLAGRPQYRAPRAMAWPGSSDDASMPELSDSTFSNASNGLRAHSVTDTPAAAAPDYAGHTPIVILEGPAGVTVTVFSYLISTT